MFLTQEGRGNITIRQIADEQKHLAILGDDELEDLYSKPHFAHDERGNYFPLSHPEKDLLQILRSTKSKAYLVLQLGYFRAKFFKAEFLNIAFCRMMLRSCN